MSLLLFFVVWIVCFIHFGVKVPADTTVTTDGMWVLAEPVVPSPLSSLFSFLRLFFSLFSLSLFLSSLLSFLVPLRLAAMAMVSVWTPPSKMQ